MVALILPQWGGGARVHEHEPPITGTSEEFGGCPVVFRRCPAVFSSFTQQQRPIESFGFDCGSSPINHNFPVIN